MNHATKTIIGAIAGDIIGSFYEGKNFKAFHFSLFTSYSTFTDEITEGVLRRLPIEFVELLEQFEEKFI